MTDIRKPKPHRLSVEILGLIGLSAFFAVILLLILVWVGGAMVDAYCFRQNVVMTELEYLEVDRWIWGLSGLLSAAGFSVLFLSLLGDRMTYIQTITRGIHALRRGIPHGPLPMEGRNELTQLAETINNLSETQQQLREKEQQLAQEKETFLRALSHDIRTPLTAILAYCEYLTAQTGISPEEQKRYLQMLLKKAEQIRDLSALLLDGDRRNPEDFEDAGLLMQQLAAEFEEELEDSFDVRTDLSGCPAFSGRFDLQELRRILDNLGSNVRKYADPTRPVSLEIRVTGEGLWIRQSNSIAANPVYQDSYKLGLHSIRRIAHNYNGQVTVLQDERQFSITVILADY